MTRDPYFLQEDEVIPGLPFTSSLSFSLSACPSFCHPEEVIFSIQLCGPLLFPLLLHLPRCVPTVKSCCEGGNPKSQEQEACMHKEVRSGNGCSPVHCQVKDTVQQPAASFRLWGLEASGPGAPISPSVHAHSGCKREL